MSVPVTQHTNSIFLYIQNQHHKKEVVFYAASLQQNLAQVDL